MITNICSESNSVIIIFIVMFRYGVYIYMCRCARSQFFDTIFHYIVREISNYTLDKYVYIMYSSLGDSELQLVVF